jgi:hypothetical protein
VSVLPENGDGQRSAATAVAAFLDETELTKKPKTLAAYTTALSYFTESCTKISLKDIERTDLLKFCAFLRDKKNQAPRTVYNKFENVMTFLKVNGIRGLAGKNYSPRYTEEEPEMKERTELDKLFKACDAEEQLWYEFFLMTRNARAGSDIYVSVGCEFRGLNCSRSATSSIVDGRRRLTRNVRFRFLRSS